MSLCPEAELRAAMSEGEFWAYVFLDGPDVDLEEAERSIADLTPCPVCGNHGPCGYDIEGRPLVHTIDEEEE